MTDEKTEDKLPQMPDPGTTAAVLILACANIVLKIEPEEIRNVAALSFQKLIETITIQSTVLIEQNAVIDAMGTTIRKLKADLAEIKSCAH